MTTKSTEIAKALPATTALMAKLRDWMAGQKIDGPLTISLDSVDAAYLRLALKEFEGIALEPVLDMRPSGCLGRAAKDEPIFVLRARDVFAPLVVDMWAAMMMSANMVPGVLAPTTQDEPMKITGARDLAEVMRAWQKRNGSKIPD